VLLKFAAQATTYISNYEPFAPYIRFRSFTPGAAGLPGLIYLTGAIVIKPFQGFSC
jgi:hypothetical protein